MKTDIRPRAEELTESLRHFAWFRFVGIGQENNEDIFIVYVSRKSVKKLIPFIPNEWKGIPVVVRYITSLKAGYRELANVVGTLSLP